MHTFHCCFLGRAGTSLDTMCVLLLLETEIFKLYRQTKEASVMYILQMNKQRPEW